MKRAYVVVGPESAGNRLCAGVLVAGGCVGGASVGSALNGDRLPTTESPVVFVRSLPHGGKMPDLPAMWTKLAERGYSVTVLVTVRDLEPLMQSQCERGHAANAKYAEANVETGYEHFFGALDYHDGVRPRWRFVSYEALVLHPNAAPDALLSWCGLGPWPGYVTVEDRTSGIVDQNRKHYQGVMA